MSHPPCDDVHMNPTSSYKPSVYYFRKALRESSSQEGAIVVGLVVCHELEQLKAWVREQGMIPPKWLVLGEEADEKGWCDAVADTEGDGDITGLCQSPCGQGVSAS
jgi:hypothetical protein